MIGLEVICQEYQLKNKDVAKMIGVSPGTFNDWLSGRRNIPQERIKQLSELEIFKGIPEEFFQNKLTQYERLKVESIKTINEDGGITEDNQENLEFNECKINYLEAIEKLDNATIMNWNADHQKVKELMNYYTSTINLLAELFSRNNEKEIKSVLELLKKFSHVEDQEPDIEDATHWICSKVPDYFYNCITVGKLYKLLYDEQRDEYYFYDDMGRNVNYFLTAPGRFVTIKN